MATSNESLGARLQRRDPFWPAQLTVLAAILLGVALPAHLTIGEPWLVPVVEAALFGGLVVTTPNPPTAQDQRRRRLRIGLAGIVSAMNVVSLLVLARSLVSGANVNGRALLEGGATLWLTAVLLFAVWFWELDRGGPVRRMLDRERQSDFLFPPMQDDDWSPEDWQPQLSDYLYLSLTNAAAFSPAETVPLTRTAKLLMSLQTLGSLTTMTVVLAYAINNLH
jgi:uncharacterized membrane protein